MFQYQIRIEFSKGCWLWQWSEKFKSGYLITQFVFWRMICESMPAYLFPIGKTIILRHVILAIPRISVVVFLHLQPVNFSKTWSQYDG